MTKAAAHKILDDARAGKYVTEGEITEALKTTGDLERTWGLH